MLNLFRKNLPIGIDISDYSIEVLQLSKNKGVLAYNRTILEESIVQDGKIIKKEKLAEKLKEVLEDTKPNALQAKNYKLKAILSLPESKIFIHHFKLPRTLQGKELRAKIIEEASKIIPLDQKRIYWDYIAVPDKDSQYIVYIGALREVIDEYIEAMRSVEVEVGAVDIESLSLSRALIPASHKSQAANSIMIIDIGARTTNISVFNHAGVLILSTTIPIAGNLFTKAIAEKLEIENKEAENLKRKFGFDDKEPDNKVLSVLQSNFQKIINDLKEAMVHCENSSGEKIEEIILAGGSALLPKIDEYLTANLEKKVAIGNPLKQINGSQLAEKKYPPILFANVIGLALRGIGNISAGVNLLPKENSIERKEKHSTGRLALSQDKQSLSITRHTLNDSKKSRVFVISFVIIAFVFLGVILYRYIYTPTIPQGESPISVAKVESIPENEVLTPPPPVMEVLPEKEKSDIMDSTSSPQTIEEKVIIQDTPTGWLNVREGPGANYNKVTQVKPGETYTLLEKKENWYKIKIDPEKQANGTGEGTQGWITSQYAIKQ